MDSPVYRLLQLIKKYTDRLSPGAYRVEINILRKEVAIYSNGGENRIVKTIPLDNKLFEHDIRLLETKLAIMEYKLFMLDKLHYIEEPNIPLCAKYKRYSLCIEEYNINKKKLIGYLYVREH